MPGNSEHAAPALRPPTIAGGFRRPVGAIAITMEDFVATAIWLADASAATEPEIISASVLADAPEVELAPAEQAAEDARLVGEVEAACREILSYHDRHPSVGAWLITFCEQALDDAKARRWDGVGELLKMMASEIEHHKQRGSS